MRRLAAVLLAGAIATGAAVLVPALSSAGAAPTSAPHTASRWVPTKGIAVDLTYQNSISDQRAMVIGTQLFSMLHTKFHANAVSLNFPFVQAGSKSSDPRRASMTPSPGRLEMLTELARRYGLAVQYRPFLWENNLAKQSRPGITPANVGLWFKNYWTFLQPYLVSADEAGAQSFSIALEFTTLLNSAAAVSWVKWPCGECVSDWTRLVAKAKTVYDGPLLYSQQHVPQVTIPLTARGYDAYQPIVLKSPSQVSVGAFTKGFVANLRTVAPPQGPMQSTPADLTIEELGIPAVAGAYLRPNWFHYNTKTTPVDRAVQADWFAGACNAFRALHLRGIYFWSIDFNTFTPGENSTKQIYNWLGTPSAAAIASCFARTP